MDSKQRYIEDSRFEVEDWFAEKMARLEHETQNEIIYSIARHIHFFPKEEGWTQEIYGVVKEVNLFYALEYLNEKGSIPIVCDIHFVDSDEYLDAILQNKTIETYEIKNTRPTKRSKFNYKINE